MTITILIKNVYGIPTIYPVCEKAKIFTALSGSGRKTLTLEAIAQIKLLGYTIVIQPQTL